MKYIVLIMISKNMGDIFIYNTNKNIVDLQSKDGNINRANQLNEILTCDENQLVALGKKFGAPLNVLEQIKEQNKLPVVNFAAGGIATPADAALMMQLGCDGVFVGSGIFKSGDPAERAEAIVIATTNFNDPKILSEVSKDLGEPMVGINIDTLSEEEKLAKRGW